MHDSDDYDFEHFEGMSKEEFQEWLYENRHLFGEIFEEFEEYEEEIDSDSDAVEFKDGVYHIRPFGASQQKFAEVAGGRWICYMN